MAIGDDHYTLLLIRLLAWMHFELGERAEATALHEEVVQGARATGNRSMEATSLGALGEYALEDDRIDDAMPHLAAPARISDEIGDRPELVVAVWRLARALAKAGRAPDAASVFAAAEALRVDMGAIEYPWMAPNNADTRRILHERLSDVELDRASQHGRSLSPREAIELALASLS